MLDDLRELWRFRELLATMVKRDLKVRYKNSTFGILWSFMNPLLMTLVTFVVFTQILPNPMPHYIVYYLAAYLPFTFLSTAILDSSQSILTAQSIVKKVYFPRELLPLSSVIGNFVHLLLGLVVLLLLLFGLYLKGLIAHDPTQVFPIQATVLFLPFVLLLTFLLAAGASLLVSALNTFYEDVKYMVSVLMYILYFLCPIFYTIESVRNSPFVLRGGEAFYKIYRLNPFSEICILYRQVILAPPQVSDPRDPQRFFPIVYLRDDLNYLLACVVTTLALFFFGYAVFNRLKWKFMERP
jgi:lipopolysaccharide transport system permease protein